MLLAPINPTITEMRIYLFFLLLLPALEVIGAPQQYVLKAHGIYCDAKYTESIEEIADANSDRSLKRAVGAAVMSGECIASAIDVPALIDKVSKKNTPRGALYYCYTLQEENERQCSDSASITTVAQLQGTRTGDFDVLVDNDKVLVAHCAEDGRVFIEKGAQWRRTSTVFYAGIGQPPLAHIVSQDKERAVRDGCRGLDF